MATDPKPAKTIAVFDAETQADVQYTVDIDDVGEIVLTNPTSGRFLKYPAGTTGDQLKALLAAHKAANEGQKTAAAIQEAKDKLLEGII